MDKFSVELSKVVNEMKLEKLYYPEREILVETADLNRPGLQITGFFDYLESGAILAVEWSENIENALPEDAIRLYFSRVDDTTRQIERK